MVEVLENGGPAGAVCGFLEGEAVHEGVKRKGWTVPGNGCLGGVSDLLRAGCPG